MPSLSKLYLKGTSKTPEISLSPGIISISGRSIPEDSVAFYQPVINWIDHYTKQPEHITKVNFRIEYINSGSNRFVYAILKLLDTCHRQGQKVVVNWYYEDDDEIIRGLGTDLSSFFKMPIKLVELN
jgi:hypothetical protein